MPGPTTVLRRVGALALLGVGAVHLYALLIDHYARIPTIGTLFVLNAVAAGAIGFALLVPVERLAGRVVPPLLAAAGAAVAAGSLVALWVSETFGLFGFTEVGFRTVLAVAVGVEVVALLLLGSAAVLGGLALRRPGGRLVDATGGRSHDQHAQAVRPTRQRARHAG